MSITHQPKSQESFWQRNHLPSSTRLRCLSHVRSLYPDYEVKELETQGWCSYSVLITATRSRVPVVHSGDEPVQCVVQFRPKEYSLDVEIARFASEVYGSFVPTTRTRSCLETGAGVLEVYAMSRVPGVSFDSIKPRRKELRDDEVENLERGLRSLADFVGRAWSKAGDEGRGRRADSPLEDLDLDTRLRVGRHNVHGENVLEMSKCTGKVGAQLQHKLARLATELPNIQLQERAAQTLDSFNQIMSLQGEETWPVVLNHGDSIPTNILVDPTSGGITGIVDWAEAEWLPFGICLYSVEHFLGYLATHSSKLGNRKSGRRKEWVYYDRAEELREHFWRGLVDSVPALGNKRSELDVMRDAGVLLWYGYAWDEGRIDRVVNEEDDLGEVVCLSAFLGSIASSA